MRGRGLVGSCCRLALPCNARDDPLCAACGIRGSGDVETGSAETGEPLADGADR